MSKHARTVLILAVFLFVAVPALSIGSCEYKRMSFQAGYDELHAGDSKQSVIELMGQPATVEPCRPTPNCTGLVYYALLERWIIYVDSNDKVIDKVNHEGFF